MKKLIALLLALTMIFTLSCPAYAATVEMAKTAVETMRGKQLETNIHDLLESYKATDDANEQIAIFNELVACYSELDEMGFYHSDIAPLASNYVTIVGTPTVSNNKATIKYKVNMAIPNGATVSVGFEYPGAWRQSSPSIIAKSAVGTYSQTISTNIMMGARYFTRLTANSYTEKQTYGIYYGGLNTSGVWNNFTHIVSSAEAVSNEIATDIAFSLICKEVFITTGNTLACKVALYVAGKSIEEYRKTTTHKLIAGQCHVTSIRFVNDTVYIKNTVYSSISDYNAGRAPLETNTHSFMLTGYPTN